MTCMRVSSVGALALLVASGCSTMKVRVETVDASATGAPRPRTVVLVPLVNRSDDKGAATAVHSQLTRALAAQAAIRVLDVPAGIAVDPTKLDRDQARELARLAGADGVLTGIVFAYGYLPESGSPPCPTVRFDVRLFGTGSGDLTWAARASGSDSAGVMSGGATLTTIAAAVADRVADDLAGRR